MVIGKIGDGVKSFCGFPIGVFDTMLESASEPLILLMFSLLVISSTFGDFFKISPFCDTKSESFLRL